MLHVRTETPGAPIRVNYTTTGYNTLVLGWITPQLLVDTILILTTTLSIWYLPTKWGPVHVSGKCTVVGNSYNITDLIVNTWYNMTVTATNYVGNGA